MVALAAKARVIDDTVRFTNNKANLEHFASKGLIGGVDHLLEEISHGGRGSIVKRAPILLTPKILKKLGPLVIPLSPLLKLAFLACIAGTGGACAGAGKYGAKKLRSFFLIASVQRVILGKQ